MKLFPSTLLINPSESNILQLIISLGHDQISNNPDIYDITEYNITSIRQISKFLSQKPLSHNSKIVLIKQADLLPRESQNALLKNLEEPGLNNFFILTTSRPHSLLATIISRCQLIQHQNLLQITDKLLTIPKSINEKMLLSESIVSDKTGTITYLEDQLSLYHREIVKHPTMANHLIIKKIIKAISLLKANIDPKTSLDFLLLS